jgi:hypothetical protein
MVFIAKGFHFDEFFMRSTQQLYRTSKSAYHLLDDKLKPRNMYRDGRSQDPPSTY